MFNRRKRGEAERPPPEEVFAGMRRMVLDLDPGEAGLAPTGERPLVWGALMEIGHPQATITIVVLADGTTSLYTSSGFGIIGGGGHESVVTANRAFLAGVESHIERLAPTEDTSVPAAGQVVFRALTFGGRRAAYAPEPDLAANRHELAPLFRGGHEVITQLRLIHEAGEKQA